MARVGRTRAISWLVGVWGNSQSKTEPPGHHWRILFKKGTCRPPRAKIWHELAGLVPYLGSWGPGDPCLILKTLWPGWARHARSQTPPTQPSHLNPSRPNHVCPSLFYLKKRPAGPHEPKYGASWPDSCHILARGGLGTAFSLKTSVFNPERSPQATTGLFI